MSSDRKTIHIFNLKNEENQNEDKKNQKSVFGKITNFFGMKSEYFNSEWSCIQFRINDMKSICAFGSDNTFYAISSDGKYLSIMSTKPLYTLPLNIDGVKNSTIKLPSSTSSPMIWGKTPAFIIDDFPEPLSPKTNNVGLIPSSICFKNS